MSIKVSSAPASGNGPKYAEPSLRTWRVLKRRGKSSFVIFNTGYDFPSLSCMLYLGEYFFMRLFSSKNASYSFEVVIYSIEDALEIRSLVFISFSPEKYDESLFLRLLALPT